MEKMIKDDRKVTARDVKSCIVVLAGTKLSSLMQYFIISIKKISQTKL